MAERDDWQEIAFGVYRLGRIELLEHTKAPPRSDLQYYVEEVTEALLDLKQATLAADPDRALHYMEEVLRLISELRSRSRGGE
jgi:hypothetical protein